VMGLADAVVVSRKYNLRVLPAFGGSWRKANQQLEESCEKRVETGGKQQQTKKGDKRQVMAVLGHEKVKWAGSVSGFHSAARNARSGRGPSSRVDPLRAPLAQVVAFGEVTDPLQQDSRRGWTNAAEKKQYHSVRRTAAGRRGATAKRREGR